MQKKSIIIYVTAIVLVVAVCFTSVFFIMKKNSKGLRRPHKPTAQTSESVGNTEGSTEMLAVEASLDSMNTTQPAPDISQDYIYTGNGTLELIYITQNADKFFYYCGDQLWAFKSLQSIRMAAISMSPTVSMCRIRICILRDIKP